MAWRNVWRNTRRSVVTIGAMTLALFSMVIYSGLVEGYFQGMVRNVVDLEFGDVQVHAAGYLDRPSKYTTIDDAAGLLARLDAAGVPASARLVAGALIGTEESSAGVALRGIDIEREALVSGLHEVVAEGQWLDPTDAQGVVLGRRVARKLLASPGDELVVLAQAMDGGATDALLTVRGVLQGVGDGTDRSAVLMNEATFRELMAFPRGAHQIVARRPQGASLEVLAAQVRAAAPDLDVKTWRELMPLVSQMLDSTRGLIYFVFMIVYLAIGILILNAMLMAVFERIREFGVFKAIGGGPGTVFRLILAESVIQIAIATGLGLGLSLPVGVYLSRYGLDVGAMAGMSMVGVAMDPTWYGVYTPQTVAGPVIMLYVIALGAVLYPALKAAFIRPVDAMRYQ